MRKLPIAFGCSSDLRCRWDEKASNALSKTAVKKALREAVGEDDADLKRVRWWLRDASGNKRLARPPCLG